MTDGLTVNDPPCNRLERGRFNFFKSRRAKIGVCLKDKRIAQQSLKSWEHVSSDKDLELNMRLPGQVGQGVVFLGWGGG